MTIERFALCLRVSVVQGLLVLLSIVSAAPGQAMERMVVTATRSERAQLDAPAAVSLVERGDIQTAQPTFSLAESLRRVPGLLVQDAGNYAQDVRLQIRGFGTRSGFGIREIRLIVDGLPETLPDGQSQVDTLDLGAIESIEVLRRPAAALYGNASGGVVRMTTLEGPDEPWVDVRVLGGSYDTQKYQLRGGGRSGDWKLTTHAARFQIDGYRDHSASRSTLANVKLRRDLKHGSLTLLLNAVDAPLADDAGGLTRAQADDDPRQARDVNVALDAGESLQQVRGGAVFEHDLGGGNLSAYAYLLYRDFENRLPVSPAAGAGIVSFDRVSPGGGVQYARDVEWLGLTHALTLGSDVQYQDDDRQRHLNVDGEPGDLALDQREQVTGSGVYAQDAWRWRDDLEWIVGVRFDSVRFETDVHYDTTGEGTSGTRTLDAWSPSAGVRYRPLPQLGLFASLTTAFQTPTTTELANPDTGGLSQDLDPQTSTGAELGGRLHLGPVDLGLAGFFIRLEDSIVRFESESGRDAYRNAGRSRRFGLEGDWDADLGYGVRWVGALTWIDAEFRDYRTGAGTFDGNDEPGIPAWQVFQEVRYEHPLGAFAAADLFVVDELYVDDANRLTSERQELVGLRLGWEWEHGPWTLTPFVALSNLFDQRYDGTVRINALGDRAFEPGPGRAVVGGVGVQLLL